VRPGRPSRRTWLDKEALIRLGQGFKARAITARARLDRLQKAAVAKLEAARQGKYWNSRE
jgi:hypothetical protein